MGCRVCILSVLPDSAVRESKERVRSAIRNNGYDFPLGRITINLSPADVKKEGPSFDLAIALGILAASEQIDRMAFEGLCPVRRAFSGWTYSVGERSSAYFDVA